MAEEGDISFHQGPIFEAYRFIIIPSDDLSENESQKLVQDLKSNGAVIVALNSETRRIDDFRDLSHIIATNIDFPDYEESFQHMIHTVKPSWVEMSIMKRKATNPRQYSPDPCLFMSDVILTCANIPQGDKEAINGGLLAMGGQCSPHLSKLCTHIVALTMDNDVCQVALRKNLRCKIVLPHWFDDCLKLGRRIDERPYLLPNPELFRRPQEQMSNFIRRFDDIVDAIDPSPQGTPEFRQSTMRGTGSVLHSHKLFLSKDLGISDHLRASLTEIIVHGEGEVVSRFEDASIVVCQYREGFDYLGAYRLKKEIGNLGWLYYLITHNTWTSPMRRLLHYPLPLDGVDGITKDMKISISCYTGEARIYLENLINAAGGTFTKTMKQDNTHLITAHTASEKFEAAKEWNVNIINHLWLEESYAQGTALTISDPRYTTFPLRTNLGEVVGQTPIRRSMVHDLYVKAALELKEQVEDAKDDTLPQDGDGPEPEDDALPQDNDGSEPTASTLEASSEPVVPVVAELKAKTPSKLKNPRDNSALTTPATSRITDGKENETPLSTGGRKAKDRAKLQIQVSAKDILEYEKEKKRVGGVTHGRDRSGGEQPTVKVMANRKRQSPDVEEDEDDDDDDDASDHVPVASRAKASKRVRMTSGEHKKLPPISERLLVSRYPKWDEKDAQKTADKNSLRNLGIFLTDNPADCSILCAPRIVRTMKFVSAIAAAPRVVNTKWLDYVLKNHKLPADGKHPLEDRVEESRLGFKLEDAVERAALNQGHLLRGWQIFCSEGVVGGYDTYKQIIEANGGICTLYKGRSSMTASKRSFPRETQEDNAIADNQGDDDGQTLYLLSEEQPKDKGLWGKFRALAEREQMVPKIVKTDWILNACTRQKVDTEGGKYEIGKAS